YCAANDIAVDDEGNAYLTGAADPSFPTTPGAYQTDGTAFITKLNTSGAALSYSTHLGLGPGATSSFLTTSKKIAIDRSGNAFVCGAYFVPAMPPFTTFTFSSFVIKVNGAGAAVTESVYWDNGGEGNALAVDTKGNIYVTGGATGGVPTTPEAFQPQSKGLTDAFIL